MDKVINKVIYLSNLKLNFKFEAWGISHLHNCKECELSNWSVECVYLYVSAIP